MKFYRATLYFVRNTNWLELLLLISFVVFFISPLTNMVMEAFRFNAFERNYVPEQMSLRWFQFIIERDGVTSAFYNSYMIAIVSTALSLLVCIPAAYALARLSFPFKHFFLFSFLLSNAFPKMGLYISIGVVFYKFDLIGTLTGVMIIHIINSLTIMTWITSAAFKNIQRAQEEAARDVGASRLQTFWWVTLPLASPGIAVATIFTFLESLEESTGTLLVGMPNYKTLPTAMYGIIFDTPMPAAAAFAMVYIVPIILLLTIVYFVAKRSVLFKSMFESKGM